MVDLTDLTDRRLAGARPQFFSVGPPQWRSWPTGRNCCLSTTRLRPSNTTKACVEQRHGGIANWGSETACAEEGQQNAARRRSVAKGGMQCTTQRNARTLCYMFIRRQTYCRAHGPQRTLRRALEPSAQWSRRGPLLDRALPHPCCATS